MSIYHPFRALEISLSKALLTFVTISVKSPERFVIQCGYKSDISDQEFYYEIAESDLSLILGSPSLFATLVRVIEQELDLLTRPLLTDVEIESYLRYMENHWQNNTRLKFPMSIDDFLKSVTD